MNNVDNHADPKRGILLTDKVDMNWLKSVTPQFYGAYIKFVVDFRTEQVYIGMDFHADCVPGKIPADEKDNRFRGGNIFFDDGHIIYESTLNIKGNLALGGAYDDILIVEDSGTISRIDSVLSKWVEL